MRWVTYSRQPMDERRAGVERMLADDPALFWRNAAKVTRQIDDWPMIRLLCEKARETERAEALPWLIQSWAMASVIVPDADRPEREAIVSITSQPAADALNRILFEDNGSYQPATYIASWSVLVRIVDNDVLRARVLSDEGQSPSVLISMLRQALPAVEILPADRDAVARMVTLLATYPQSQWADWARWRDAHRDDRPATLSLRHLPILVHRDKQRDTWSRDQWQKHIALRLADRRHVSRGASGDEDAVIQQRPDRFEDHVDRLGIADLMVVGHLLDALADPAICRLAFEQAEADRVDTTTEYGGALAWNERGEIVLKPYPPMMRRHDQAYIASSACINAVYLGLAHFHFHTQKYDNAAWAGPGKGDLDFADAQHANAIVFTFLDRNTLNVDAYFPGGIAIDLGCVTR